MSDFPDFLSSIANGDIKDVENRFREEFMNMTDESGLTALHNACWYDDMTTVIYLLDKGCDIESETLKGKHRPVSIAVMNGHISLLTLLIDRGCLLNVRTKYGETPFDVAIRYNRPECVEIIQKALKNRVPKLHNYTKEIYLGNGTFGKVFKCFDPVTEMTFAVKEIVIDPTESQSVYVTDLENEIYINAQLKIHPRIVRYFGTSRTLELLHIFLEYMPGGTIKSQLTKCSPLPLATIVRYTKQILEGLAYLHQKEIIHRDVKAANILRDTEDNIKLCDFGISRQLQTISLHRKKDVKTAGDKKKNMTTSLAGSIYWMAPEVARGDPYNTLVDVWSLGATVVEMLTGNPPYHELEPRAALFRIGMTTKFIYKFPKTVPTALKLFIEKMFVVNPAKRESVQMLLKSDFIKENS